MINLERASSLERIYFDELHKLSVTTPERETGYALYFDQ